MTLNHEELMMIDGGGWAEFGHALAGTLAAAAGAGCCIVAISGGLPALAAASACFLVAAEEFDKL